MTDQQPTHEQLLIERQAVKIGQLTTQIESMFIVIEQLQAELNQHRSNSNGEALAEV